MAQRKARIVPMRPTAAKTKVNPEVFQMMQVRHDAHRRGAFLVIGSISLLQTAHGVLRFPVRNNVPSGPTIGVMQDAEGIPDPQTLIVLTEWKGVPDLVEKTDRFCPDCLAGCYVCEGKGEKVCEGVGCGGSGVTPGPFEDCDGAGCMVESGHFNPECPKCKGFGQVARPVTCLMCAGTGKIQCSFCKGQRRYSTGRKGGSTDLLSPRCATCNGEQREVIRRPQPIEAHINALLPDPVKGPIVAVGPIDAFTVDLTEEEAEASGTPVRVYELREDSKGDRMFLLLDSSSDPAWPYLVGGVISEKNPAILRHSVEVPR